MNLKPIHYFLGGVALTALIAAAKFVGGTPLDQTFTYQGQLRNAGQLVSGPVDLKVSMWDADTGGSQVGSTNTFNAMQLNDGRFACGLNFGNAAFDGSNRWIQVEFRNPAGSGQYQALSPRDKITATPYALYALNGANGVWVYDTNQQSVSVMGKKVGIGTSNPTAALEVVSATGGDDSVKLPAGSIGESELAVSLPASATLDFGFTGNPGQYGPESVAINFVAPGNGWVTILGNRSNYWGCSSLKWNGQELATGAGFNMFRFPVTAGESYSLVAKQVCYISTGAGGTFLVLYTQRALN
jgi:hypothetical protein